MLASMNRVIVFVGDVEKCAEFYRRTFDLTTVESTHAPDEWLELEAGGCRLAFHKAHGADGPVRGPTGGSHNPHKIVFKAEDVPATRELLVQRGAAMDEVKTFGEQVMCDGSDPEGHRFQITNR